MRLAARVLPHPGMPGTDREYGEVDSQAGDENSHPADQRPVSGEARKESADPSGKESGSGGQDDPALAVLGQPARYEHEHALPR